MPYLILKCITWCNVMIIINSEVGRSIYVYIRLNVSVHTYQCRCVAREMMVFSIYHSCKECLWKPCSLLQIVLSSLFIYLGGFITDFIHDLTNYFMKCALFMLLPCPA
jgi:hypothetical protein